MKRQLFAALGKLANNDCNEVVYRDGGRVSKTWAELARDIDRAVARLVSLRPAGREFQVGLVGPTSYQWMVLDLACLKAGFRSVAVPEILTGREIGALFREAERALLDEFGWLADGEPLFPEGASVEDMWRAVRPRLDAPAKERLAAELQRRFPLMARVIPHLPILNPVKFVGYINRFRSVLQAGRAYRPTETTTGPIEILTATRSRNFDPRWSTHTSATYRRRSLDGDHFSILDRGSVRATPKPFSPRTPSREYRCRHDHEEIP